MTSTDPVLFEKKVSALLDGAQMRRLSKMILGLDGQISAALSKKMIGGQWISGKALIKTSGIEFQPSRLNQPFFKNMDDLKVVIRWADLLGVKKRFGAVASIIDLETADGTFSMRCLGVEDMIRKINAARKT